MFGGRPVAGAVVTWGLVAANVVIYLIEIAYPKIVDEWTMFGYGVAFGQWYRVITSAFLHEPLTQGYGILHILFNMWALVLVGPALEMTLGRLRYLSVYLVSALGGSILFYLLANPRAGALGASGAIFGLFGAWFVLARRLRVDSRLIVGLIVINLVLSFVLPDIGWQAHVGGLICGGVLTAAYVYAPRRGRGLVQAGATIAMVALLVVGLIARDHALVGAVRL